MTVASSLIVGYDNKGDAGTYSAGSWLASAPLDNVKNPIPGKKARSSDAAAASTKFRVDLLASVNLKLIAITHTNLTSAATYKLTWYSDAFITAVDNTGFVSIPGYPAVDPDSVGAAIFHVFSSAKNYRYWQVELSDIANPAGYVEVGRSFFPKFWQPTNNFGEDNGFTYEPNTDVQESIGGTEFFNRRQPRRKASLGFSVIEAADAPTLREINKVCGIDKQVVLVPDPDDTTYLNDTAFVGRMKTMPVHRRMAAGFYAAGYEIGEVV